MATRPAAPPVDVSTSSPDITTEPCSVELRKGDFARLKFRLVPGHRHDEQWQHRPVRAAPIMPAGQPAGPLAYYNNSKTASNSNVLQVILRDHGYSRVESFEEDWSIMWCAGQMDPKTLRLFMPHQRINKFPRATTLTLKSNLWMCVNHLRKAFGEEHFGFMPTTFCLPKEMAAFDAYMRSRLTAPGGEKDLWICKPTAAYCGRGIFLHRAGAYPKPMYVREAEAMREGAGEEEAAEEEGAPAVTASMVEPYVVTDELYSHKGVACRYIDPPFLLNNLKSDIRLYVLVTSFHPLTVYLYGEGLARFATEPYDTSEIGQRCGHLTNYSLNKHNPNFQKNTDAAAEDTGSKWSLSAFKRRLVVEWGEQRAAQAWREVDELVVKTCIAAEYNITASLKENSPYAANGEPVRQCFQVFGFDVMFDASSKPYLLEVNLDPALRTESPLDLKIKSSMLVDLLNVVGMPMPPPPPPPAPPADAGAADGSGCAVAGGGAGDAIAPEKENAPDDSGAAGSSGAAGMDISEGGGAAPDPRAQPMFERWRTADATEAVPPAHLGMSDVERFALHMVNTEFTRSKEGGWRRLFPSARSEEYFPFLEPSRKFHFLPFDV